MGSPRAPAGKVFISHTTADDEPVAVLAAQLRAGGLEVFNDGWEVQAGKDFVAWINKRLEECDAGILVFSPRTVGKPWVEAEISALIYMRVAEGKQLIPVLAWIPTAARAINVTWALSGSITRFARVRVGQSAASD